MQRTVDGAVDGEKRTEGILHAVCRLGQTEARMEDYLALCRGKHAECPDEPKAKDKTRFPNAAGFCRFLGTGVWELEEIRRDYPAQYELIFTILEDEALNSDLSPALLSVYLKKRLGYEKEAKEAKGEATKGEPMTVCFEHNIWEDGE